MANPDRYMRNVRDTIQSSLEAHAKGRTGIIIRVDAVDEFVCVEVYRRMMVGFRFKVIFLLHSFPANAAYILLGRVMIKLAGMGFDWWAYSPWPRRGAA